MIMTRFQISGLRCLPQRLASFVSKYGQQVPGTKAYAGSILKDELSRKMNMTCCLY